LLRLSDDIIQTKISASLVFDSMPKRNEVSWTSMMSGYGMHGRGKEALDIFDKMQKAGFVPDDISFLVLLYACSHSGMVDQGLDYFDIMRRDYGVVASAEHYACVIDLLARSGRLDKAWKTIQEMPMEPSAVVRGVKGLLGLSPLGLISRLLRGQVRPLYIMGGDVSI